MPKLSIIIPVYNTAPFLRRCLDSVVNQTYSALEIIVVNDGSTDESLSIIKEYAAHDNRIVCIDKPNGGLPLARKSGVEKATGKYIQHLDSDDELVTTAIRTLVDRAEETAADIVALPFYYTYEDGTKKKAYMQQFGELTGMEYYQLIVRWKCHCNVWANFQRRALFVEHSIEFVPDIYEDLIEIQNALGTEKEQETIKKIYPNIRKISIDYAVMEPASKKNEVMVIPGNFGWNDIGSWDMLDVLHPTDKNGNISIGDAIQIETSNTYIYSTSRTVTALGVEDLIVVETPDAVMVCRKDKAQDVKKIVDAIKTKETLL